MHDPCHQCVDLLPKQNEHGIYSIGTICTQFLHSFPETHFKLFPLFSFPGVVTFPQNSSVLHHSIIWYYTLSPLLQNLVTPQHNLPKRNVLGTTGHVGHQNANSQPVFLQGAFI